MAKPQNNDVQMPADLAAATDQELDALRERIAARANEINEIPDESVTQAHLDELETLEGHLSTVAAERQARADARADLVQRRSALREKIDGHTAPPADPAEPADQAQGQGQGEAAEGESASTEGDTPEPAAAETPAEPAQAIAAAAQSLGNALVQVLGDRLANPRAVEPRRVPLAEARQRAGAQAPPARLAITAGADIPNYPRGGEIRDLRDLANAFHERARSMSTARSGEVSGPIVASIANDFEHVIDGERTSAAEVGELLREIRSPERVEALVAAGGWCAPSETRYDFFNIAEVDASGTIDLPTVGIQRGGIKWPTSPSMADVFTGTINGTTNPWLWTETDDEAAVTGSPTKPCVRVPCPDFNEARLDCTGICVTAGNLASNAYPESISNFLRLLEVAHERVMNQRNISRMVALSTAPVTGGILNDAGAISVDLPAAVGWAAVDYRARYSMRKDATLEVILPYWIVEVLRTDLAQRTGVDMTDVPDSEVMRLFTARNVRIQLVNDWQIRGTNQPGGSSATLLFPGSVEFMIYAAGTFVRGRGMRLDLGVVRDSVLNETNDHTAAWTEECDLIFQAGHESRRYQVAICAAGRTGNNNLVDCRTS